MKLVCAAGPARRSPRVLLTSSSGGAPSPVRHCSRHYLDRPDDIRQAIGLLQQCKLLYLPVLF